MTRNLIIFLLMLGIFLFPQLSTAQDSLWLLATIVGERECASAGDINGDGFKDIITGYSGSGGHIKIFLGSADFDTIPDLHILGGGSFGWGVGCAGDVNKDGYDDFIAGAPGWNSAYLYFGGNPPDSVADLILQEWGWNWDFGASVTTAGDVNNDGYADVMVAAPRGWDPAGRVFIYLGGEAMDSIYDVCINGQSESVEELGTSIAGLGDINGDGYDDILIGSPYFGNPFDPGKAEIYLGGNPMDSIPDIAFYGDSIEFKDFGRVVASAGDVNGDGIEDILVGGKGGYPKCARLFTTKKDKGNVAFDTLILSVGDFMPSTFGNTLSSAGDINGDGFDDFMVGDYQDGVELKGKVYIFYGGEDVDSLWDITLFGPNNNERSFGVKLAKAGDINGDGYDEIMISSYFNGDNREVFIFTSNPTSVEEHGKEAQVRNFHLNQNYPNPFNPETVIEYVLPENFQVKLSIYNILGQHIKTLVNEYQASGFKRVKWNGEDGDGEKVSSGIYFYKIQAGDFSQTKKMLLLK